MGTNIQITTNFLKIFIDMIWGEIGNFFNIYSYEMY